MSSGHIRAGIGGWTFEPWRGVFYPEKLTQAKELSYAASKLTSIEINGTYYGSQKPESFRKWASEVPDGFVFSVKGPRFATNRRVLAEAGDSIKRFYDSGVLELGDHCGWRERCGAFPPAAVHRGGEVDQPRADRHRERDDRRGRGMFGQRRGHSR